MVEKGNNGLKRFLVGMAIAIGGPLLIQSGTLIWWASNISTRVKHVERELAQHDHRIHEMEVAP